MNGLTKEFCTIFTFFGMNSRNPVVLFQNTLDKITQQVLFTFLTKFLFTSSTQFWIDSQKSYALFFIILNRWTKLLCTFFTQFWMKTNFSDIRKIVSSWNMNVLTGTVEFKCIIYSSEFPHHFRIIAQGYFQFKKNQISVEALGIPRRPITLTFPPSPSHSSYPLPFRRRQSEVIRTYNDGSQWNVYNIFRMYILVTFKVRA